MVALSWLKGLPSPLLFLVAAQLATTEQQQQQQQPVAIRKMGFDAGEKFWPEYYAFDRQDTIVSQNCSNNNSSAEEEGLDASASLPYRAPLAPHLYSDSDSGSIFKARLLVSLKLQKRDFACPTGTSSCSAIGYPDSCCQTGTTCVQIDDTGLGSVGCCPAGEACTGTISCSDGQQGCSSESGGGCCIPGWECASVGCTQSQTATPTTTTAVTQTSTAVSDTTTTTTTSSTTTAATSSQTSTSSSTSSSATSTTTMTTTTAGASAPVRPTSGSNTATYCPTGFYACSAVYGGGCCQTGRDCQVTSCPTTASTTIISNGATIVVPASDATATATTDATCASGWSICPASAGPTAGCCPTGYSCGTASCFLATGSATASVAKELPGSAAAKREQDWVLLITIHSLLGLVFGVAFV